MVAKGLGWMLVKRRTWESLHQELDDARKIVEYQKSAIAKLLTEKNMLEIRIRELEGSIQRRDSRGRYARRS